MFRRLLNISIEDHCILFGARGVGKSTYIEGKFSDKNTLWINLLRPEVEEKFSLHPEELKNIITIDKTIHRVVIDEIQKCPKLLDSVQDLIEHTNVIFFMTGSSARKLKRGAANLLAGRAFYYAMHPLTHVELENEFDLLSALQWGTLPKISQLDSDFRKRKFLQSYALMYLKEEIWGEHLIRKLEPFRRFLELAAQMDGKIINLANIARDVGVDANTIKTYFDILAETHLGFWLEAHQTSVRKQIVLSPKFYFFDCGVSRALSRQTNIPLQSGTSAYGDRFEQFIILEIMRLNDYFTKDFKFSYLLTKAGVEIDLIIERPGQKTLLIEIKSATFIREDHLSSFAELTQDFKNTEAICLSQESKSKKINDIFVFPWKEGLKKIFEDLI